MSFSQLSAKLHFQCLIHANQPLNMFCQVFECPHKGMACSLCQQQLHQDHKLLSLRYILTEVLHDLQVIKQGNNLIGLTGAIDEAYVRVLEVVKRHKRKQSVSNYFAKVEKLILKPKVLQFTAMMDSIREGRITRQDLEVFLLGYKLAVKQESDRSKSNYEMTVLELIDNIKNRQDELDKSIKQEDKLQNMLHIYVFDQTNTQKKVVFSFSEVLKHINHTIIAKNTVVQKNCYSTVFALVEPALESTKKDYRIKSIKFKILRLTSWVTLGVCHEKIISGLNYIFNTGTIGHGAYCISNDGYSWHNTVSTLNSFENGWTFVQGDIVQITYNPKSKMLKYSKNGDPNNSYEMQFDSIPGDKLHFCVTLSNHDESVQIVT